MWEQFQRWLQSKLSKARFGKAVESPSKSRKYNLQPCERDSSEVAAMIEKIHSIDWEQYSGGTYYNPDKVVSTLIKLCRLSTEDKYGDTFYYSVIYCVAGAGTRTYYPVVESALPIIIEVAQDGQYEVSRNYALEALIELFCSYPDLENYNKIDEETLQVIVRNSIVGFLRQEPIEGESSRNKATRLELIEDLYREKQIRVSARYSRSEDATGWFELDEMQVMRHQQYPDCDCAWLAMDKNGNLGVFITAGVAPIPVRVLEQSIIPVEDIETQLCEYLPVVSEVNMLVEVGVDIPNSYIALASRGLFVYDWTDVHRDLSRKLNKYELVAYPVTPIIKTSLDGDLLKLAEEIEINFPFFSLKKNFFPEAFFECADFK